MWKAFIKYLREIKPTLSGTKAILLMLLVIPGIADLLFFVFLGLNKEIFSVTAMIWVTMTGLIPLLFLYLLGKFLLSYWYNEVKTILPWIQQVEDFINKL